MIHMDVYHYISIARIGFILPITVTIDTNGIFYVTHCFNETPLDRTSSWIDGEAGTFSQRKKLTIHLLE